MLKVLLPFCTKIYSLHSGDKSQASGGGSGLDNMEEALRIAWMIVLLAWITTCQWEGEEKLWSNHNLAWSHSNWQHKPRVFPVAAFLMITNHSGCLQWENLYQEQPAPLVCSLLFCFLHLHSNADCKREEAAARLLGARTLPPWLSPQLLELSPQAHEDGAHPPAEPWRCHPGKKSFPLDW